MVNIYLSWVEQVSPPSPTHRKHLYCIMHVHKLSFPQRTSSNKLEIQREENTCPTFLYFLPTSWPPLPSLPRMKTDGNLVRNVDWRCCCYTKLLSLHLHRFTIFGGSTGASLQLWWKVLHFPEVVCKMEMLDGTDEVASSFSNLLPTYLNLNLNLHR